MENVKVIVRNGVQLLTYKGEVLPMQKSTTVVQDCETDESGWCRVMVTFRAELPDSEEEMVADSNDWRTT